MQATGGGTKEGFTYLNPEELEDYACAVCLEPFWEPVTHACGNTFCRACLSKCRTCPLCRAAVVIQSCPSPLVLKNRTNSLRVKCNNCTKTMERQQFQTHTLMECFIFCKWGCATKFVRSSLHELPNHEANCNEKPQKCINTRCGWNGRRGELVNHLRSQCLHATEVPPVIYPVACTLEDIFRGTTKKYKITTTFTDIDGSRSPIEKVLEVTIPPGSKAGMRQVLRAEGNIKPGEVPADLVFVLSDKMHPTFRRDDNNNLYYEAKIPLRDALCGFQLAFTDLEGANRSYPVKEFALLKPDFSMVVRGLGMPEVGAPQRRGDLVFQLSVDFPSSLTAHQQKIIKDNL